MRERHRFWIKRKVQGESSRGWQPRKRYRVSTKHWVQNLDNAIKHGLGKGGLSFFALPSDRSSSAAWNDWRSWPHLMLAIDQGSDGLSGGSWMRSEDINVTLVTDWSHACQNDMKEALRSIGLFPFMMLMMIVFNMEGGPFKEESRFWQVKQAFEEVAKNFNEVTCDMFRELCPKILEDMRDFGGGITLDRDEDAEKAVWAWMVSEAPFATKGETCCLNRYMAVVQAGRKLLGRWHLKQCQYEMAAVESGMLGGERLQKLMLQDPEVLPDGSKAPKSTSSARPCVSEKALRSTCQNALVISALMLGEPYHNTLLRLVCVIIEPVERWHRAQNHKLRSFGDTKAWLIEQSAFGFNKHLGEIAEKLTSIADLNLLGFLTVGGDGKAGLDNDELLAEEGLAELYGEAVLSLISARGCRLLWFTRGWPLRLVCLLKGGDLAQQTLASLKTDIEAFQALVAYRNKDASLQALEKRSLFQHACMRQYMEVACCELCMRFCAKRRSNHVEFRASGYLQTWIDRSRRQRHMQVRPKRLWRRSAMLTTRTCSR